jgi:hypothetical protein
MGLSLSMKKFAESHHRAAEMQDFAYTKRGELSILTNLVSLSFHLSHEKVRFGMLGPGNIGLAPTFCLLSGRVYYTLYPLIHKLIGPSRSLAPKSP